MRLIHYSHKHITEVYDVEQVGRKVDQGWKPAGLWVSVEDDHGHSEDGWHTWCSNEKFGLERLACPTEVILQPDANILRIEGDDALLAFHEEYGCRPEWAKTGAGIANNPYYDKYGIDVRKLAKRYDGIIIAPYSWKFRLDLMWYYSWDCASGCIWKARAVAELRQLPMAPVEPRKKEDAA